MLTPHPVADFDGDGNPDLTLAEQEQSETDRVAVFYNLKRNESSWGRQGRTIASRTSCSSSSAPRT
jgi:hypothetical protein